MVYHYESLQSKDTFLNGTTEVLWQLLVTLKNKKATLEVASKLLQECEKIWKWHVKPRRNSSWSQIFHVICQTRCMAWVSLAASRTWSLVFIDDVTTDRRSRMNCEVYMAIVYSDSAKCCKTGQTTHTKAAQNQLQKDALSSSNWRWLAEGLKGGNSIQWCPWHQAVTVCEGFCPKIKIMLLLSL